MRWDQLFTSRVVDSSLDSSVDTADRQTIRLVKMSRRAVVLQFPVLDNESAPWPVTIYGQPAGGPVLTDVPEQPVEAVLSSATFPQYLIA